MKLAKKGTSRTSRWQDAVSHALSAIDELESAIEDLEGVRQEYEEWRDNLPENLQNSALADKLNTVADMDFSSVLDDLKSAVEEADSADLPLGFGRD